ncbi:MAG: spermidine synthase [Pseudomonadota bacterium]
MGHRLALFSVTFALTLSGAAGLGYQIVWTRTLGVGLGHEIIGLLAVVTAFFAGLALGAWWLGRKIRASRVPGRWYVGLEIAIGLWGLTLLPVLAFLVDRAPLWLGPSPGPIQQCLVILVIPALVFAPATIAMGGTLPAMERVLDRARRRRHIALVYAANTSGALLSVLAYTFFLIPWLGFRDATFTLVGLSGASAVVGAIGVTHYRRTLGDDRTKSADHPPQLGDAIDASASTRIGIALCLSGFLGLAYETLVVRVMSQVFEGAIYSFAAVLTVYLLGTVVGASAYQRWGRRAASYAAVRDWLALATAVSAMLGVGALYWAFDLYRMFRLTLGDTLPAVAASEVGMALPVLIAPSALMGALFCHLVQAAEDAGKGIGWGIALNTFGATLAPAAAVLLILPLTGAKWALVGTALGYLLIASWSGQSRTFRLVALAPIVLALCLPSALRIVTLRDGERILQFREGAIASVAVVEKAGTRNLRVNNRFQMGGTVARAVRLQRRQAHIPLLLHPNPSRALFLGVASGVTLGTVIDYPRVQADAVELVPEALEMLPAFAPVNRSQGYDGRVRLFAADARRFVRSSDDHYDVIVADLFHPGRDGSGFLFTREHFRAISERLAPDGLFCQWLPLYQLDASMLRAIIASFNEAFPWGMGVLANFDVGYPALGLIGRRAPAHYPPGYLAQRLQRDGLDQVARRALLHEEGRLLGLLMLDPDGLKRLGENTESNTDDHPRVLFEGPRFTYQRGVKPYRQLRWLLDQPSPDVARIIGPSDPSRAREIRRYIGARDTYLRGLMTEHEQGWERALPFYEASLRTSPSFTASFAKLFAIGQRLLKSDPTRARALLDALAKARPGVPALERLRRKLKPSPQKE